MAQQKTVIDLPLGLTERQRDEIGNLVVEHIVDRAQGEGKGFNPTTGRDKKFPRYSKGYKGGSTFVDLTLSNEMLNELKPLTSRSGSVTVGFDAGTEANGKAEGNQKGTYGKPYPIPGKQRPFLGITKTALKEIIKKVVGEE